MFMDIYDFSRKLPIGIQSFEKLRDEHCLYVDKTRYLYNLVHTSSQVFLSRPRRFGKSLFLSTLKAYWEGRKDLFEGLWIFEQEEKNGYDWKKYPVFYFDFNKKNFHKSSALEEVLDEHLRDWEDIYGKERQKESLEERFRFLLEKSHEQTGLRCVVLVDEYDKSLLETLTEDEIQKHNKAVFKGFFSTLKSYDEHLQFVFITGVTKFTKISIFSDLNQLTDISVTPNYSEICGITQDEIHRVFDPEVKALAKENNLTFEQCLLKLKQMYDGYHFCDNSEGVYNPFSLLNAFSMKKFRSFWFETGTPTFLIEKLEQDNFDAKQFTAQTIYKNERELLDYRAENTDPVPLFYQSGYLTIKDYDERRGRYTLGYPNEEVKYAFIESLAPSYLHDKNGNGIDIFTFDDCIEEGRLDEVMDIFISIFARIPYVSVSDNAEKIMERDFQNVIYIVFMLLGKYVHVEMHTALGRADCVVETEKYIYIFEFKRDGSVSEALYQIEEKGYAKPYTADKRKIFKIGVNFSTKNRNVLEWKVGE